MVQYPWIINHSSHTTTTYTVSTSSSITKALTKPVTPARILPLFFPSSLALDFCEITLCKILLKLINSCRFGLNTYDKVHSVWKIWARIFVMVRVWSVRHKLKQDWRSAFYRLRKSEGNRILTLNIYRKHYLSPVTREVHKIWYLAYGKYTVVTLEVGRQFLSLSTER